MPFLHHIVCRSQGELSIFPRMQEGRHHGGHVVVANSVINLEDFSCKYFAQTCLTTADSGEELIVHNTIHSWTAQNLSITSCKTFNWVSNTEMQNLHQMSPDAMWRHSNKQKMKYSNLFATFAGIGCDWWYVGSGNVFLPGQGWRRCQQSRVLLSPLMDRAD